LHAQIPYTKVLLPSFPEVLSHPSPSLLVKEEKGHLKLRMDSEEEEEEEGPEVRREFDLRREISPARQAMRELLLFEVLP